MKMKRTVVGVFIGILGGSVATAQPAFDALLSTLYSHSVPTITADSLAHAARAGSLIVLDTRSEQEFEVSHIRNARFIDYEGFTGQAVAEIPRDTPIVVYCSVGYRSEKIGEQLLALGFTNVRNLYGGIFQWKNAGFEVVNTKGLPTDSVHTYNQLWSVWLKEGVKVYE